MKKKKTKNKKGFTLIELLSILVILGFIATITVPIINNVIKKAKDDAAHKSVEQYIAAAKNFYAESVSDELKKKKLNTNIINMLDVQNNNAIGEVSVDKKGDISIILTLNNKCYIKSKIDEEISVSDDVSKCSSYLPVPQYVLPPESCFETLDNDDGTTTITGYKCGNSVQDFNYKYMTITYNNDGEYTNIEIPSIIRGKNVTSIGSMAFMGIAVDKEGYGYVPKTSSNKAILLLVSYETPKFIYKSSGVYSIVVPEGVTSIGDAAFAYGQLKSISLPSTLQTIGSNAFAGNQLTNVVLPNNIEKIENSTFFGNQLINVTLPERLKEIDDFAFYDNKIDNIVIPASVTNIGARAFGNNQLKNVVIPASVTNIGDGAFGNNQLKNVVIPNNIEEIESNTFDNNQLTSVTLPANLKTIKSNAFSNNKLSNINIPLSVTSIGTEAFNNNQLPDDKAFILKRTGNIVDGKAEIDSSTLIGYGGAKRSNVVLPSNIKTIATSAFSNDYITSITLSNNLENIGNSAFNNDLLNNIEFPSSVKTIGESAFARNNIEKLNIPNTISSIGDNAFFGNRISDLSLPLADITYGDKVFNKNSLPDSKAFVYKTTSAGVDYTNIISYGGLKRADITIPEGVVKITNRAFSTCELTGTVNLPSSLNNLGIFSFAYNRLTNLNVPGTLKYVGGYSFLGNNINTLTLNEGIETLSDQSFMDNNLTTLVIPTSVKNLYFNAFAGNQLTSVIIKGKSSSKDFENYDNYYPFGWAEGYDSSNIIWQP